MSKAHYSELVTREQIVAKLNYDPETGLLTHRYSQGRAKKGVIAGTVNDKGYRVITVLTAKLSAHRVAWIIFYGDWPKKSIDHIDGNKDNNKISNLRECEPFENSQNIHYLSSTRSKKKSKYTGVRWCKRFVKWQARITIKGERIYLGAFDCEEDAYEAYKQAKALHHKFHPTPNPYL